VLPNGLEIGGGGKKGGEREESREEVGKGMRWRSHQAEPQRLQEEWKEKRRVQGVMCMHSVCISRL
jgi:hypothetical protein